MVNNKRNSHKRLAELREQIEALTNENRRLESENRRLRERIAEMEASIEETVSTAVSDAVRQATEPLLEALAKANAEIERLNAIINKNSSNSSKPPSTDGFNRIPNSREPSGKPRGGQKGHPGRRLGLPENIEELERRGIVERRIIDNTNGASKYISRYTIDIEVKVIVTEHRYANAGDLPESLKNEVSYGDSLKAAVLLLSSEGMIADKRLSDIVSGLTNGVVNLSTATLYSFQKQLAQKVVESGVLKAIEQDLLDGEVMHTDDTGVRSTERIVYPKTREGDAKPIYEQAKNKSFRVTIRTYSNERSTIYTVNPQKDKAGVERDGILPKFNNILCHDHESKFRSYGKKHANCCEHLCRDLKGLYDTKNCGWAMAMRAFMYGMNEHKKKDLKAGIHFCDPQKLAGFESEYDIFVEQGRAILGQMEADELGRSDINAMLNRLTDYKDSYMLFIRDYKAPFTNNLAERDLRPEKTKDKISGPFRSWEGTVVHTQIRSVISTAKKRGMELLSTIDKFLKGEPIFQGT